MLLSLVVFAVTMYITPGPNNVMLASSAANYGVHATLPHMLGINLGFSAMLVLVGAGLGSLLMAVPALLPIMRWVGAAWLLYLAWKIASAAPPGEGRRRPLMGVPAAAAFQWINPKAWLIAIGAASAYMLPDRPLGEQIFRIGVVFLAVGFPCMLPWALLGSGAGRVLRSRAQFRAFNVGMALLLVLSLVPVLMEQ